jgi:hypothetical protein
MIPRHLLKSLVKRASGSHTDFLIFRDKEAGKKGLHDILVFL